MIKFVEEMKYIKINSTIYDLISLDINDVMTKDDLEKINKWGRQYAYYVIKQKMTLAEMVLSNKTLKIFGLSHGFWAKCATFLNKKYKMYKIPKKNGGYRIIHEPPEGLKMAQREILLPLLKKLTKDAIPDYIISYKDKVQFQNEIDCHVDKKYIIKIDLMNYFNNIKVSDVMKIYDEYMKMNLIEYLYKNSLTYNVINNDEELLFPQNSFINKIKHKITNFINYLLPLCFIYHDQDDRKYLPQGAPTSPWISNLVFLEYDKIIKDYCDIKNYNYTRYCDDLIISGNDGDPEEIKKYVIDTIEKLSQFKVNRKKARIIKGNMRKKVLGVVVNKFKNPPRWEKRLWRAIKNNIKKNGFYYEMQKSNYSSIHKFYQHWLGKLNWWASFNDKYKQEIEYLKQLKEEYKHEFFIENLNVKEEKVIVNIKNVMKDIHQLMEKWDKIEWLAFMYGKKYKNDDGKLVFEINKLNIPPMDKQSGGWVETQYTYIPYKLSDNDEDYFLGYIHSHHSMGAYFSNVDLKQFEQVEFAIVVAWKNIVCGYKDKFGRIKIYKDHVFNGFEPFDGKELLEKEQ